MQPRGLALTVNHMPFQTLCAWCRAPRHITRAPPTLELSRQGGSRHRCHFPSIPLPAHLPLCRPAFPTCHPADLHFATEELLYTMRATVALLLLLCAVCGTAADHNTRGARCRLANCRRCDRAGAVCLECKEGYSKRNNAGDCAACGDDLPNCSRCSSCSAGRPGCTAGRRCTHCKSGYILQQGACVQSVSCLPMVLH